jgi:hypothetical protein
VHVRGGIAVAAGSGIAASGRVEGLDILQVAPSVLAVMGVAAPRMEAGPFPFVTASARSGAEGAGGEERETAPTDLNEAEEEEVLERLRGLGYVD